MVKTSFYTTEELKGLGLASYGSNVKISRNAKFYSPEEIRIGNHVRIDDFCILSGKITIGNYVHINAYSGLFASDAGIQLEDFVNMSSRITIYAISDDYSGETMTSPLIPEKYKRLTKEKVVIGKYVIMGTGTSILPGVRIGEGCAIGSMSLVKKDLEPWGIYAGVPCRFIKPRSKNLLQFVREEYEE